MKLRTPELFFVSPFGKRSAREDGSGVIDFDLVYREAVVGACHGQGWAARRGDAPPGATIIDAVIDMLFRSELVVADVTLPNPNVYYELGLRHSISSGATVLIAQRGTSLPFDIAHRQTIMYDYEDLAGLRAALSAVLEGVMRGERPRGLVREALERFGAVIGAQDQLALEQDFNARLERAENNNQLIALWHWVRGYEVIGKRQLAVLAKRFTVQKNWSSAAEVLERACAEHPHDFELRRMHGWTLRKLGRLPEAERELRAALKLNEADPEALAILGAILKNSEGRRGEARDAYKDAAKLSPDDLYVLVNLAAIELLMSPADPAEGKRLYGVVLGRIDGKPQSTRAVWDDLMAAEACFVLGNDQRALRYYGAALARPDCTWQIDSAVDQLGLLRDAGYRRDAAAAIIEAVAELRRTSSNASLARSTQSPRREESLPIIIHLSDLHFGTHPASGEVMHRFGSSGSRRSLADHIKREFSCGRKGRFSFHPDRVHVVISGDITYSASESEFAAAAKCLDELCGALGVPKNRVVIAPGNHDVNWKAAQHRVACRFDDYLTFLERFYGSELLNQLYPRIRWPLSRSETVDASDLFSVYTSPDEVLQIVTLNSCVHETESNHWGFVGEAQLDRLGDVLDGTSEDAVRVAVVHHHIHPYPEHHPPDAAVPWLDNSLIRDGGALEAWLEDRSFDVVLHGHKHKAQLRQTVVRGTPQVRRDVRPLVICGAGSAGVQARELPPGFHNQYQVLEFLRAPRSAGADFLRISWRELPTFPLAKWVNAQEPWVLTG